MNQQPPPIPQKPKKSQMRDIGILLIVLGFLGPIVVAKLAQAQPPGASRAVYAVATDILVLGLFVGLILALIGSRRNRLAQKQQDSR